MPTRDPSSLQDILKEIEGKKLPPVHKWNPALCGDIDIRIKRDGTWFYNGTPIGRKKLVKLFSTVLRRDDEDYYLVTPAEKLKIKVDDAPFVAVELRRECEGKTQKLAFRTNTDDWVVADRDHPIRVHHDVETGEPAPYILIRDKLEALINRPVFYELVEIAERSTKGKKEILQITSDGETFLIGEL